MFKEAISSLTSSVVGAAKSTARAYIPTSENLHGTYDHIAQFGISNIAYRSPILANVAETMWQSMKIESVKKDKMKSYLKSKDSDGLRSAVTSTMDETATSKQIDKEMSRILDSISKSIEKNGQEETKKSDIFKQFGKFFSDFKGNKETPEKQPDTQPASGSDGDVDEILTRIETNTHRTVNVLEELTSKHMMGGNGSNHTSGGAKSFIDPMTGMPSLSAAVGHVGGSFLSKIFDNDTIERFANKTKKFFDGADAPEQPTAKQKESVVPEPQETTSAVVEPVVESTTIKKPNRKGGSRSSIASALNGINADLNTNVNNSVVVSKDNTSESSKETEAASDKRTEEIVSELKGIKDILSKSNSRGKDKKDDTKPTVEKIDDQKTRLLDKVKDKVLSKIPKDIPHKVGNLAGKGISKALEVGKSAARYAPKIIEGAGSLLRGGASLAARALPALAGGAALVGAAGAGGYMIGSSVVNPLIDKGLSAVTGRDTSLGSWIYDKMNPDVAKEATATTPLKSVPITPKPVPVPPKSVNSITALKTEKEKQDKTQSSAVQPIVINNSSGKPPSSASGGGGGNASQILSVRNQESTFEKVQMQDFWSRTV